VGGKIIVWWILRRVELAVRLLLHKQDTSMSTQIAMSTQIGEYNVQLIMKHESYLTCQWKKAERWTLLDGRKPTVGVIGMLSYCTIEQSSLTETHYKLSQ
jgi:hypothetical protein